VTGIIMSVVIALTCIVGVTVAQPLWDLVFFGLSLVNFAVLVYYREKVM
jgi:hypothetical protein